MNWTDCAWRTLSGSGRLGTERSGTGRWRSFRRRLLWPGLLVWPALLAACANSVDPSDSTPNTVGSGNGSDGGEAGAAGEGSGGSDAGSGGNLNLAGQASQAGEGGACDPRSPNCMEAECGDGLLDDVTEECDDGGTDAGDGCSDMCQLEPGWVCPVVGADCRAAACGDGIAVGWEQCDHGAQNGTGVAVDGILCSETCRFVMDPAKCGNGELDPGEPCDDGNNDLGDGCGILCEPEPLCPPGGGACPTACGDGLLLDTDMAGGQACDDGNNVDGDGCSATCELEPGFVCEQVRITPDELVLPIVYRDFQGHQATCSVLSVAECLNTDGCHPDFARFGSSCRTPAGGETGIVEQLLGADGKPVHVAEQRVTTVNNDPGVAGDLFAAWYRDDAAYNVTLRETLPFSRVGEVYQFTANPFFPIDVRGSGNSPCYAAGGAPMTCAPDVDHNYHFTSEVRYWFEYRGGEQLQFFGDDDVWVFINKRLAVDIGGVHGQALGSVVLDAQNGTGLVCDLLDDCLNPRHVPLDLELGKVYEIVVFQAERNKTASNYQLTLSNFERTRSQCASICGDGIVTPDEACDDGVNDGSYGTCNPDCSRAPFCGDGILQDPPEQCDDGNNQNGDGCSSTCNIERIR